MSLGGEWGLFFGDLFSDQKWENTHLREGWLITLQVTKYVCNNFIPPFAEKYTQYVYFYI